MRYLELRRHTQRVGQQPHISQAGLELARQVGQTMGPFAAVLSSPAPRCIETAVAMGFAVQDVYEPVQEQMTKKETEKVARLLPMEASFVQRAEAMRDHKTARQYARMLVAQWAEVARRLPPGKMALVLTHGGYVDDSAVACLPEARHERWGKTFGHCEGIRLAFDRGRFVAGKLLRG